jgi:tRNA-dihydrouridine synthase B
MVAQTGCDAVMIGRTAPSNPWIFRQIQQYTARIGSARVGPVAPREPALSERSESKGAAERSSATEPYDEPTDADRYQMIRTYFQMLIEEEMPGAAGKMKQFASWFTHGIPGGAGLRKAIYESKDERAILVRVEEFFERTLQSSLV